MKVLKVIGKVLLVVLITVVFALLACIGMIYLFEKGPSESAKVLFVKSVNETSRMGFLGNMFLSDEEVEEILTKSDMQTIDEGEHSNSDLIDIDEDEVTEDIEVVEVSGSSFKGTMLIVHDPSRVFLGTIPEFGQHDGMVVSDIIDTYNANGYNVIAGINGGDFIDLGTNNSYTGQPLGAVFSEGQLVYCENGEDYSYHLAGFTNENKFVMGVLTIQEARDLGIRDAVYSAHETGPFLVMDGVALVNDVPGEATYGGGKNPRTVIGQRADGAVLMLVVDGRQANSLGATFKDLAYLMLDYGAVNAAAMDGGTSSQLIYEGEMLSHPYSAYGARKCPTAWLVQ